MFRRRTAVPDVVTPTPQQELEAAVDRRRRRYVLIIGPCLALVVFGFFVPAPLAVRVVALVIAAPLPPIAVILASPPTGRRR